LESFERLAIQPGTESVLETEDGRLVAAVLRKDRKATAEFVGRYSDPIYRYVRSRLSPRTDLVDDLVQEIFLAAWQHLRGYRGDSSLRAWLLGIARHKVEDYYRSVLREAEPLDEMETTPASGDPGLEILLDRKRLQEKTLRVLAGLPPAYRVALLWRYWEKRSAREMAVETGRTEKAIERLLARARSRFRERWNNEQRNSG
jgi:RNA polymerase sigma-70 factor (ECF subfamily)